MSQKIKWSLCFALLSLLLLTAAAGAAWEDGGARPAVVVYSGDAGPAEMYEMLADMEGVTVLWAYDAFFRGAAVEADGAALRALARLDGVESVAPAAFYESGAAASYGEAVPSEEGLALMGADGLWEQGYTGDGLVVAVIDSGLNVNHAAFADASLVKSPAISKADVEAFAKKGGTAGRYLSSKIPFVYDYYSNDTDVTSSNQHGTHVTALAAGYAGGQNGFRGAAPGAQILGLKIFPDGSGSGTNDTIILRALEDAWNLGADVINISVGTGAGFSASDVMDGLYCRAFRQMAEDGVIVCAAAGNSKPTVMSNTWSQALPTGAYTDYSSLFSPGSLYGAVAVAASSRDGKGGMEIADYSSWGPASGLHLCPALTAFGGPVNAASASDNTAYRSETGTSMASGSMSGHFAVLLQALRERGITGRREAAALAQSLAESTAALLTDGETGLPVSPRRQGAGYIDLAAAAESELVVMNPLVELGESGDGKFTMNLTIRNLSGEAAAVSLDTVVLTDRYVQEDGVFYSCMAPEDITSGVSVTGDGAVTIPAKGEVTVKLDLAVGDSLRRKLAEVYSNGFYVEGYVTATGGNQPVHAAFLGYCGDWEAGPVLEPSDFRDVQDAEYRLSGGKDVAWRTADLVKKSGYLRETGVNLGANLAFLSDRKDGAAEDGVLLGANSRIYALHHDVRNAVPAQNGNATATAGGILRLDLYSLRNAAGVVMLASNPETKEVYFAGEERLLEKSVRISYPAGIASSASFAWDVTDGEGTPLPAGTNVRVDVYAWLDTDEEMEAAYAAHVKNRTPEAYAFLLDGTYEAYRELTFPVAVDGRAPVVSASMHGSVLTLTLRDDNCVSYAVVRDTEKTSIAEQAYLPEKAGEECVLTVDFSGRELPETVYIQVEDYASHQVTYTLNVKALAAGEKVEPVRGGAPLLADVKPSAWYAPAVDFVLDKGIMEMDGNMSFRPDDAAVRWETVTALYRASGSPASKYSAKDLPFSDVSSHTPYADALCWAYERKVVAGRDDGTFGGSASVTRQELAAMLYRCAGLEGEGEAGGGLTAFPDASTIAPWASDAMAWAVGRGLIRGNTAGRLVPGAGVTRAETAQILMRFVGEG